MATRVYEPDGTQLPYIDKWGAVWKRKLPTGRYSKPTTPWPSRSYIEFRVNGVNQAQHEDLEARVRKVVDDFITEKHEDLT